MQNKFHYLFRLSELLETELYKSAGILFIGFAISGTEREQGRYGTISSQSHVELILHLLDWARMQSGRTVCKPEKFFMAARLSYDIQQVLV